MTEHGAGANPLAGRWPLVGREAELASIERLVRSRRSAGLVIAGPPGVGKTRLVLEALERAGERGFAVERVVGRRATRDVPLGALARLLPVEPRRATLRAELLQHAADALAALATPQGLMLAVDDAHLLDDTSAAVVLHLAARVGAVVVVTVRSGEPVPEPVTELWKEGITERVDLAPLDRSATGELLRAVLGGEVDTSAVHEAWTASRGNVLYLREMVLGAFEAGLLRHEGETWVLDHIVHTPRLVELVEARLAHLDDDEREVLHVLAVGEVIGLPQLVAMTDAAAVERLERGGVVDIVEDGRRRHCRLAHPLYGEVVRAAMPAVRVMLVKRRLADELEARGARRREDVLSFAAWRLDGGGPVQPDFMLAAAERARRNFDDGLAERLAREAAAAGAGPAAALLLAEVLVDEGRHAEAGAALDTLDVASTPPDVRLRATILRCVGLLWGAGEPLRAAEAVAAAEAQLPPELRDGLAGIAATVDLLSGRVAEAISRAERVTLDGERQAVEDAAAAAAAALALAGRGDDGADAAVRGLLAHDPDGDGVAMADVGILFVAQGLALSEAGRLAEARTLLEGVHEMALSEGSTQGRAWIPLLLGRLGLLEGRLRSASRSFHESATVFRRLGHEGPLRWCAGGRAMAAAMAGDVEAARASLAELDALSPHPLQMVEPDMVRSRAWVAVVGGDRRAGVRLLEEAAVMASEMGALALEAAVLHDRARLGDAQVVNDRLRAIAAGSQGPLIGARALHATGLATSDAQILARASEDFEAMGALLFAAEAAAGAAGVYRQRRDRRAGERWSLRARALVRRTEGARTPGLAVAGAAATLTPREREVAELAAAGLANRDIAEQLYLSVRTVTNHLQRAYDKLGVGGRGELAAALHDALHDREVIE